MQYPTKAMMLAGPRTRLESTLRKPALRPEPGTTTREMLAVWFIECALNSAVLLLE
jgi:hypothetical protein